MHNNIFVIDIDDGNTCCLKVNETMNGLVFLNRDIGSDGLADGYEKGILFGAKNLKVL